MAHKGNGDPPIPDLRTMEELCQPSLNGRALKAEMVDINKNLMSVLQVNQQVKAVTPSCETCGDPHSYNDCPTIVGQTQNVYAAGSYQDALILMPKFGPTIKTLLTKKDKLYELARTPLNEHCSPVLLKKLPEKLGDPDKFLILCDFPRMDECLALVNLGASINLMPLSVWNKLSLHELSSTCMTLKLANRSSSHPVGVFEDVFVKVGTFHFPADFVVVDFNADPRAITFNLDQTSRYSVNYNDMTTNRIDIFDMAYEEYSQEVLGFFDVITSGNPTPYYDPIVSTSSLTLTPFGNRDFLLEEVDAFLALEDDQTSPKFDQLYFDLKGDILLLEAFLNDDPSLPPPNQGNYLPQVKLKDLPPYLEYVFLEGDDKFSIIIAKDLSDEEKTALITVLKSHKRAIAWNLSDIKENEENELIPNRLVTGWRVCIDYRKLNEATRKDHFPLPFMDQILERLAGNEYYRFLDEKMLKRCEDTNLYLNWEKSHFMVNEGIVLGHKISKDRIEVDKAKVDVIAKLPHPTTVKAGSESRPPMLNKENYVPWSSRLLRYAKSDANRKVNVTETFHLQTDDELSEKELKQIEADDQAIQTILLGLPEDIYAAVDSCETAQEIWLRVQQMMKGSNIGIQEKKAKLFNEWERFTSNEGESIESYYHRFLKLMNDLKRNKHFPEKIASNLKFLNNLQPEWNRHVTIVHQTKDLHTPDYTQLYDFLKYNQKEVDELKTERLANTQDPLALMANSNNPYVFQAPHQDQSSFNQNYLQQPMPNPEDITDPTTAMNMALTLMTAGNPDGYNDVIGNQVIQNAVQNPMVQNVGNQNGLIGVQGNGNQNHIGNGNLVAARAEGNAAGQNGNQIRCYNCRGVEEYDLMAAAADLDEIEEVNANCLLMANLQQASTSGTQTDSAPVYDTDVSAEFHRMANSNNPYASPAPHQDLSPFNYMQQPMPNPEDITDSTTAMNMALTLMAKAFKLNYSTPTNNNQRISSNPRNRQIAHPGMNMGQDRQIQMIGGCSESKSSECWKSE
nr:reverse transcriptase domain-containing protein [Tanacetum cinerariifolium]